MQSPFYGILDPHYHRLRKPTRRNVGYSTAENQKLSIQTSCGEIDNSGPVNKENHCVH